MLIEYNRLIERYLAHTITEDEYLNLKEWIASSPINEKYFDDYLRIENSKKMVSILEDTTNRWEELEADILVGKRFPWKVFLAVAASILVLFSVGLNVFWFFDKEEKQEIQMCEFSVPLGGGLANLTLSDGSKVTLNSGSTITYPSQFAATHREVSLVGEAFFDVAKDSTRPFSVDLSDYKVSVLGTSFNIEAYEGFDYVKTTLFTGSIDINPHNPNVGENFRLKPHESCVYSKRDQKYRIVKEDFMLDASWRSGVFKFKDTSLQDICRKLEQIYGVEISLAPYLQEDIYTGSIATHKPIEIALQLLNYKQEFTIEKTNDTLYKIK